MKNSILRIHGISSKQIISKDKQVKVKGGVQVTKICHVIGTGGFDTPEDKDPAG